MWDLFINHYPMHKEESYQTWKYGVHPDELAQLTMQGIKTATTSGYLLYEVEKEQLPQREEYSIIVDSKNCAVCVVRTTQVTLLPFNKVGGLHAYKEGEGDRTLDYWRRVHKEFFSTAYAKANLSFQEDSLVVCEEFEILFPEKPSGEDSFQY